MAHNKKEDDKIEKMIRGLLKLPENRRCINCNSLGPQYVCTTFLTFICTNCSGIHREFTHRVKSISMAKFTLDEVNSLLAAGNERASQIYFKTWDPKRHVKPDGRDLYKLRAFIKHVYVDRKYTGDRSTENPIPSGKEDSGENRNSSVYRSESSRPNHGDRYDDKYRGGGGGGRSGFRGGSDEGILRFCYEEGRSPGHYSLDKMRSVPHRRSSARFEVVDDRVRDDDDTRKGKRLPRLMSAEFKLGGMSVDVQNKVDKANSLEVGHPTREHCAGKSQKKESPSQNSAPTDAKVVKPTVVNSKNSKPVDNDTKPKEAKASDSNSKSSIISTTNVKPLDAQPEPIPAANDGGNWASFDASTKKPASDKPMNTLEALLFELYTPAPAPAPAPAPVESGPEPELALALVPVPTPEPTSNFHNGTNQMVEPKESTESRLVPVNADLSESSSSTSDISIQQLSLEAAPTQSTQRSTIESISILDTKTIQKHQDTTLVEQTIRLPTFDTDEHAPPSTALSSNVVVTTQEVIRVEDTRNTGPPVPDSNARKELPADLFTTLYGQGPIPVRGWNAAPPNGYGYGYGYGYGNGNGNHMQYFPNPMPYAAYPNAARSKNPFDVADEQAQPPQGQPYPSVAYTQGGFFNTSAPQSTPALGARPLGLRPPLIPSHVAAIQPLSTSQMPSFFSPGAVNPNQGMRYYSPPSTAYPPPSVGGNPFG